MATQSTAVHTRAHRSTLIWTGFATVVAMMVIGWFAILRPTVQISINQPEAAVDIAPGVVSVPQDISAANRTFSDEIAGASAQDLTSAANGMQPEWIEVVQHTGSSVVDTLGAVLGANRIFADEINAGAGIIDWNAPQPDVLIVEQGGNR